MEYHKSVNRCLGLISSFWDHDSRKGPLCNPKNTDFYFLQSRISLPSLLSSLPSLLSSFLYQISSMLSFLSTTFLMHNVGSQFIDFAFLAYENASCLHSFWGIIHVLCRAGASGGEKEFIANNHLSLHPPQSFLVFTITFTIFHHFSQKFFQEH